MRIPKNVCIDDDTFEGGAYFLLNSWLQNFDDRVTTTDGLKECGLSDFAC